MPQTLLQTMKYNMDHLIHNRDGKSLIWKIGLFGGIAITILLLTSWYIAVELAYEHQQDCNQHMVTLDQLRKNLANNKGLNGQLVPTIEYLNNKCSKLELGNIRSYLER